jgi:hypothetical protein
MRSFLAISSLIGTAAVGLVASIALGLAMGWETFLDPKQAANWIALIQLLVALIVMLVSGAGVYLTFLTPFNPTVAVDAYTWKLRPVNSQGYAFEVVAWINIVNTGALSGTIQDLAIRINFPRGELILQPMLELNSRDYIRSVWATTDDKSIPAESLFAPISISGRSSFAKPILFAPLGRPLDPKLFEPGVYHAVFYQQDKPSMAFKKLFSRKLILAEDHLQQWRSGTTITAANFERPTDPVPLIKRSDTNGSAA